jgi:hypothetical protein
VETFEGERRPGAVTQEALYACAVLALDADGSVYTEPTGSLPGEHARGIGLVEEAASTDVTQDTALDDALEFEPVDLLELGGLMEVDRPIGPPGEDAVEDDEVEVEMWVEGRAEPVEESEAYGIGERAIMSFNRSPVFRLPAGAASEGIRRLAWYDSDHALRSGWAVGQQYLNGGLAAIEASVGDGKLFMFGPGIVERAQPHGTFKFLFNAIYLSSAKEARIR